MAPPTSRAARPLINGVIFLAVVVLSHALSSEALPSAHLGRFVVRFKAERPATHDLESTYGCKCVFASKSGVEIMEVLDGEAVDDKVARFRERKGVDFAEPDWVVTTDQEPGSDPYAIGSAGIDGEQWALRNTGQDVQGLKGTAGADVDALAAWAITGHGRRSVVVAVVDTGVDLAHPALAGSMWTNPGEVPGNGIDDDNNGFVDDVHGYDFHNRRGSPMDDDPRGHGTHCAGIIAASGAGGAPRGLSSGVSIMALKPLGGDGMGYISSIVRSFEYAVDMGASVVSNSYSAPFVSDALRIVVESARAGGVLVVAAAGNQGRDLDLTPNAFSSLADLGHVVVVGASDAHDAPASYSNRGRGSVDLFAPGSSILSTLPGGGAGYKSGTSMAAPLVAAAAALLRSLDPSAGPERIAAILRDTADGPAAGPWPAARSSVAGGRLNVGRAAAAALVEAMAGLPEALRAELAAHVRLAGWPEAGPGAAPGKETPAGPHRRLLGGRRAGVQ